MMRDSTARDVERSALAQSLPRLLRVDRTFGVIDACLAAVAIISIFSDQLTILLQATFLLLMLGACYWRLHGFLARTLLWAGIATAEMVVAVTLGDLPASSLVQLLVLTVMLAIVFFLAVCRHRDERTLTHAEHHDQLTRLPNRAEFMRRLDERLAATTADRGAGAVSSGHGLVGMRERVELWRGELCVGPAPGGGHRVSAQLPYGDPQ